MEYASDAYKEAMKANVRGKSYVWVSLDMINIYAQESAYISSSFTGSESGLYDDSISVNTVTSTENDGSITFTFGEYTKLLLNGVRFILNGEFGAVTATNGSQTKTTTVVAEEVIIKQEFKNCHYIKLTPNSGNLSLKKIYFGIVMDFEHDVIMNTSRSNTIKHLNEELPIKSFSFTMHNYDRLWNKDNPDSLARFVMEKQKIIYSYGRQIDENTIYNIVGGVVYLKEFTSDDYKATFNGVGILDYKDDDYKKGTIYPDGITLYQLAELVLLDAGIKKYELDSCLRTFKVTNPLPIDTHKACLQLIAHAGRCVLFEDRNGAVCLKSADRPVIYKNGYVINATNFSSGEDVVNPLTVANYASTEPSYTYADGLQYFFPENNDLQPGIDESINYFPYPYKNAISFNGQGYTFENNVATVNGFTITLNQDHSITVDGSPTLENYPVTVYLLTESDPPINLPDGTYIFGACEDINDATNTNKNWLYIYTPQSLILSDATTEQRTFKGTKIIKAVLQLKTTISNYTFFPKVYRNVTEEEIIEKTVKTLPVGFVSEDYANNNGGFTNIPKIEICFASPCRLTELVMNCAVAPSDFVIKCYLNNNQIAVRTITNNTNPQIEESFVDLVCDKFDVTFTKTTPGQRIHVNSVEPVAAVDYKITYKDMTLNPIASELKKVSKLVCELYKFTDPKSSKTSYGGINIEYNEIEGGGLSADITSGNGALAVVHVTAGINIIEIGNASIVESVEYSDGEEGGFVEIIESGAYYVKVNCSREGDVTVKGTEYSSTTIDYTIPVNEIGNAVTVSNPLISTAEHIDRLKSWFLAYYENDIEYRFDYRGDPILDADDQIFIENKFVTNNLVRIESEDLSTSAGMDTSNQIIARRLRFTEVSKTVLRDYVLSNEILYLEVGQTALLQVIEWIPSTAVNKTITYSSSDDTVATVSANGTVTAIGEGEATITATSANGITHICVIRCVAIEDPDIVRDFTLSQSSAKLAIGDTMQLSVVSWTPETALRKTVTWDSSDTSIATVSVEGLVTTIANGNVTITATCPDGISKTCSIAIVGNLISFPYYETDPVIVRNGITFTNLGDRRVTISGTCVTSYVIYYFHNRFVDADRIPAGKYIFGMLNNVEDSFGFTNRYFAELVIYDKNNGSILKIVHSYDSLNDRIFEMNDEFLCVEYCYIAVGETMNVTVLPQLYIYED